MSARSSAIYYIATELKASWDQETSLEFPTTHFVKVLNRVLAEKPGTLDLFGSLDLPTDFRSKHEVQKDIQRILQEVSTHLQDARGRMSSMDPTVVSLLKAVEELTTAVEYLSK